MKRFVLAFCGLLTVTSANAIDALLTKKDIKNIDVSATNYGSRGKAYSLSVTYTDAKGVHSSNVLCSTLAACVTMKQEFKKLLQEGHSLQLKLDDNRTVATIIRSNDGANQAKDKKEVETACNESDPHLVRNNRVIVNLKLLKDITFPANVQKLPLGNGQCSIVLKRPYAQPVILSAREMSATTLSFYVTYDYVTGGQVHYVSHTPFDSAVGAIDCSHNWRVPGVTGDQIDTQYKKDREKYLRMEYFKSQIELGGIVKTDINESPACHDQLKRVKGILSSKKFEEAFADLSPKNEGSVNINQSQMNKESLESEIKISGRTLEKTI